MFRANQCLHVVSKESITEQKSKSRHFRQTVKIIAFVGSAQILKKFYESPNF